MSNQETLMLIDGHALAYRAYHALPPLTSPSGEPTNATLGFANMLLKAIEDYAPDYVVATFDPARTFRHEEYAEYKATRAATPDDLRAQFGRIRQLTETLGIPVYVVDGFEADDLLGTLSLEASQQGLRTIIVTGDSDTFQLIDDNVSILTPQRTFGSVQLYTPERIKERYDLEPEQLVDLKALTGDSSDNIPGVRGVGAKTAARLMAAYGSLEAIYEHLDEVAPARFRNALEKGRDEAELSKHLITIVRDVDIDLDLESGRWGSFDRDQVMDLLRKLGFRTLANRIPGKPGRAQVGLGQQLGLFDGTGKGAVTAPVAEAQALGDYYVVDTEAALDDLATRLRQAPRFALDTETTSTQAMSTDLVGISFSAAEGQAYYIPVGHDSQLGGGPQLSLDRVREALGEYFRDLMART